MIAKCCVIAILYSRADYCSVMQFLQLIKHALAYNFTIVSIKLKISIFNCKKFNFSFIRLISVVRAQLRETYHEVQIIMFLVMCIATFSYWANVPKECLTCRVSHVERLSRFTYCITASQTCIRVSRIVCL